MVVPSAAGPAVHSRDSDAPAASEATVYAHCGNIGSVTATSVSVPVPRLVTVMRYGTESSRAYCGKSLASWASCHAAGSVRSPPFSRTYFLISIWLQSAIVVVADDFIGRPVWAAMLVAALVMTWPGLLSPAAGAAHSVLVGAAVVKCTSNDCCAPGASAGPITRTAVAVAGIAAFVPLRGAAVQPTVLPVIAPGLVPLDLVRGSSLSVAASVVV